MKHIVKRIVKPIVLSIVGAGLLSVSLSSAAKSGSQYYTPPPYVPTTPPAFLCASTDNTCKRQQTPEQTLIIQRWLNTETIRRAAYYERIRSERLQAQYLRYD